MIVHHLQMEPGATLRHGRILDLVCNCAEFAPGCARRYSPVVGSMQSVKVFENGPMMTMSAQSSAFCRGQNGRGHHYRSRQSHGRNPPRGWRCIRRGPGPSAHECPACPNASRRQAFTVSHHQNGVFSISFGGLSAQPALKDIYVHLCVEVDVHP